MLRDLEEELAYVRRSLEDLERERAAGDLSDEDFERLQRRYRVQLIEVEQALAEEAARPDKAGGPEPAARERHASPHRRLARALGGRRARLVSGWGALACLVAAATLIVLALTHSGPFTPAPQLSVDARVQIMLAEADILGSKGDVTQALATFDRVLALRPEQPVALANGGWLARLAGISQHEPGLVRNGDAEIEAAVRVDPGYALARAYDGVLQLQDRHSPTLAVAEFRAMLADDPSSTLLHGVRSAAVAAFRQAKEPVPAEIRAAGRS